MRTPVRLVSRGVVCHSAPRRIHKVVAIYGSLPERTSQGGTLAEPDHQLAAVGSPGEFRTGRISDVGGGFEGIRDRTPSELGLSMSLNLSNEIALMSYVKAHVAIHGHRDFFRI